MRPGARRFVALVAFAASACARPEQSLLEQFFGASRLRDTTALQGVATVVFEPRQQGIVRTFEITGVTPERVEETAVVKDVTVEAPVYLPDGQIARKAIVVTMRRAGDQSGPWRGWRVVAFRDAAASPPSPPK